MPYNHAIIFNVANERLSATIIISRNTISATAYFHAHITVAAACLNIGGTSDFATVLNIAYLGYRCLFCTDNTECIGVYADTVTTAECGCSGVDYRIFIDGIIA